MTCRDWEEIIAAQDHEPAGLAEHLASCENCRRLAGEIALLRQDLGALPEPAIESVRPAVLERLAVPPKPRFGRWAWVTAAAAVILFAIWLRTPRRVPTPAPVQHVAVLPPARATERVTPPRVSAKAPVKAKRSVGRSVRQVRIQTGDPHVVLIWVLD